MTKETSIASKKFASFEQLLEFYKCHSLRAISCEGEKILLKYPISVNKGLEKIHRMAQDELYTTLAGKQPVKPAPPSPSTKPGFKKKSVVSNSENKPTPIIANTVGSNSTDSLLDQVLQQLKIVQDELTTELAGSVVLPPNTTLAPQKEILDSSITVHEEKELPNNSDPCLSFDPTEILPAPECITAADEFVPKPTSALDENKISPTQESTQLSTNQIPLLGTNENNTTTTDTTPTTGKKSKTAPPPLPPPLPPIHEPTPAVMGSPTGTLTGSVCPEDLIDMQQRLKSPPPKENGKHKQGAMYDIFDQFNDKISVMRAMIEHSDDEDYEELEWED